MAGAYDHYLGEVQPGDTGWLPLDDNGTPNGPATKEPPPGPNAKACSVKASTQDQLDDGADALVTATGAPISDTMNSNVDRRVGDSPSAPDTPPYISSLTPSTAALGSPDFDLVVAGSDFNDSSIINFAGQDEPTTLVSPNSVKTGVRMEFWQGPDDIPVYVKNGDAQSNTVIFTFTSTSTRRK